MLCREDWGEGFGVGAGGQVVGTVTQRENLGRISGAVCCGESAALADESDVGGKKKGNWEQL